jgi:transposase-like protein
MDEHGTTLKPQKKIQANQDRFKWVATWLTGRSVYTNLFVEVFITCIACHLGSEQLEDKPRKQSPVCQSCHKLLINFVGHAPRKIMYGNAMERTERQNL